MDVLVVRIVCKKEMSVAFASCLLIFNWGRKNGRSRVTFLRSFYANDAALGACYRIAYIPGPRWLVLSTRRR